MRVYEKQSLIHTEESFMNSKYSVCDPIDSELYLGQMKSGETLMEVLNRSDVQFDGMTWVQRRKTNRTVWQLVPSEMSLRTAGTYIDLLSKDNVQATWCNICVSAFANSESVGYALAFVVDSNYLSAQWAGSGKQDWRRGMNLLFS